MVKVIVSVVIMLISAYAGIVVGSAISGPEITALLFCIIAGFACVIYTIDRKK